MLVLYALVVDAGVSPSGETSTPFGVPAFEMMRSIDPSGIYRADPLRRLVHWLVAVSARVAEVALLLDGD